MSRRRRYGRGKPKRKPEKGDFWYSCGRKKKYHSEKQAHHAAQWAQQERGDKLYVYKCDYGRHWHLTRRPH